MMRYPLFFRIENPSYLLMKSTLNCSLYQAIMAGGGAEPPHMMFSILNRFAPLVYLFMFFSNVCFASCQLYSLHFQIWIHCYGFWDPDVRNRSHKIVSFIPEVDFRAWAFENGLRLLISGPPKRQSRTIQANTS